MQGTIERAFPQVKICGLTVPEEARACAELGADAIGLVFYPPSPRHLSLPQAAAVAAALPPGVRAVGVFVDPEWDDLARTIAYCGLGAVQLHGNEPPEFVQRVCETYDIPVIKALFFHKPPTFEQAGAFHPAAFLLECGRGPLPGGNAMAWDWGAAKGFASSRATILAGGLGPGTIEEAIAACLPDAVDASSGLESSPGRKNLEAVERFLMKVRKTRWLYDSAARQPCAIFRSA